MPSRKPNPLPAAEVLHSIFVYDPDIGSLRWAITNQKRPDRIGTIAGTIQSTKGIADSLGKRRVVYVNGRRYLAARVIWKMQTGQEPGECIDHINGDSLDDRWENLRAATIHQNNCNKICRRNSISGIKGVNFDAANQKWRAYIIVGKKMRTIGRFATIEEAARARRAEAVKEFGEFARGSAP